MSSTRGYALRMSGFVLLCAGLGGNAGCSSQNGASTSDGGAKDSGATAMDTGAVQETPSDAGGLPYGCSGAVDANGRPPICNLAHWAMRHPDLASARHFFGDFLGLAEPFQVSSTVAVFKVNDSQFIEVYQETPPAGDTNFNLKDLAFYTSDAEALRKYFGTKGVKVPAAVSKNILGNTSFSVSDPDGHTMEWVQYEPDSMTGMTQGQAMPSTRVGTSIHHVGVSITNSTASDAFYQMALGFLASSTADHPAAEDPNATVRIEYGVTHSTPTQAFAVVRDHLCFRVADVMAAYRALASRDPSIQLEHHVLLGFTVRGNSYMPMTGDRFEFADSFLLPTGEDAGPADYAELDSGSGGTD